MTAMPRSGCIEANGLRLHHVAWGDPAAPPVLLVHGLRDHARSWDFIAEPLAHEYHVIAPDLRGHGDSCWAGSCGYSIAAYVLDLASVVAALDLPPFLLVGHSLGGAIALRYAAAFPDMVRRFCAIESVELPIVREQRREPRVFPVYLHDWVAAERARQGRSRRRYATIAEAEARMAERHPKVEITTIAHLAGHGLIANDGGWCWKYDSAARHRSPEDAGGLDLDECLAAIACPTLLAYGEASWIPVPLAERLALLRDCRLVTFPGATHWLHHEARAAFLDALIPFLGSAEPVARVQPPSATPAGRPTVAAKRERTGPEVERHMQVEGQS